MLGLKNGRQPQLDNTPAGCPGRDRFRGQPHRHIATSNEGFVVGSPVRNAILRLIPGMNIRLHPCSVAPAKRHEKYGPNHPTRSGSSCNNAVFHRDGIPIRRWRTAWRTVCQVAGVPTRFLHDCRRTAARNLIRASARKTPARFSTSRIVCGRETGKSKLRYRFRCPFHARSSCQRG